LPCPSSPARLPVCLLQSLQTIAFLHCFHAHHPDSRSLVVVPKNVKVNWRDEFEKWLPMPPPSREEAHVGLTLRRVRAGRGPKAVPAVGPLGGQACQPLGFGLGMSVAAAGCILCSQQLGCTGLHSQLRCGCNLASTRSFHAPS
jgi:hypothetical protein